MKVSGMSGYILDDVPDRTPVSKGRILDCVPERRIRARFTERYVHRSDMGSVRIEILNHFGSRRRVAIIVVSKMAIDIHPMLMGFVVWRKAAGIHVAEISPGHPGH